MNNAHIREMVEQCLDQYVTDLDENAFHNLRELGSNCIPMVIARFQREDSKGRIRLIQVAQEIRDEVSRTFLFDTVRAEIDAHVWSKALEGLAYQALPNIEEVLRCLYEEPEVKDSEDKAAYVRELLEFVRTADTA